MDENKDKENYGEISESTLNSLKAGGGAVGVLGGLGALSTEGALRYSGYREKLLKEGKRKAMNNILTEAEKDAIKNARNISLGLTGVGALAYGGTKAYEHYKNKKKKQEGEK